MGGDLLDLGFAGDVKLGLTSPLIDAQDVSLSRFAAPRHESRDESEETTQRDPGAKSRPTRPAGVSQRGIPKRPAHRDQSRVFSPNPNLNPSGPGAGWIHCAMEGD
jgi:hypothetical protein